MCRRALSILAKRRVPGRPLAALLLRSSSPLSRASPSRCASSPPARSLCPPRTGSTPEQAPPRIPSPALAYWGSASGTKDLLNLFLQFSYGDCTLLPSSLPAALVLRTVHVAAVRKLRRRARERPSRRCAPGSPPRLPPPAPSAMSSVSASACESWGYVWMRTRAWRSGSQPSACFCPFCYERIEVNFVGDKKMEAGVSGC